jgi:hypothetical protein
MQGNNARQGSAGRLESITARIQNLREDISQLFPSAVVKKKEDVGREECSSIKPQRLSYMTPGTEALHSIATASFLHQEMEH